MPLIAQQNPHIILAPTHILLSVISITEPLTPPLLHSQSHADLLFFTQLLSGFNAPLCLRELVWLDNIVHRSYHKLSLWTSVQLQPITYSFSIPTSKTDHIFEGNCVIIQDHTTPNPLKPFLTYLNSWDPLFPHRAELWLCGDDSIPTCAWFLQKLVCYFPHG